MTGHDYEYVVADYLRSRGYHGVKVTKGSGDFGVDVIATKNGVKYAVQCKLYSSPVGVSAVQEVVAGKAYYRCKGAMVVTNSTFTAAAQKLADMNNVILLDGVKANGFRRTSLTKKVLLYLLWLGIVGGILSEILVPIDPSGTLASIFLIPLLTVPFWIKPSIRLIRKQFNKNKDRAQSPSGSNTEPDVHQVDLPASAQPTQPVYQYPSPRPTSQHSVEELEDAAKIWIQDAYTTTDIDEDPGIIACAIAHIIHDRICSVSLIQRRLKLGYTRAASLVNLLEELGVVGPYMGSTPRTILLTEKELLSKVNRPFS